MHDDQCPQCMVRTVPNAPIKQINVSFLPVVQTEHLLDNQEELISTPLQINFETKVFHDKKDSSVFCFHCDDML